MEGVVPTLKDFTTKFLEHQEAESRTSEMRLKRQVLKHHVLPAFGHLRLDQITTQLVDGYKADKLKTPRGARRSRCDRAPWRTTSR